MKDTESTAALRELVEAEIEVDRWDGAVGYCRHCPGEHLHNSPGSGSPIVTIGKRGPYFQCFHNSCSAEKTDLNRRLDDAYIDFCAGHSIRIELTPEEKAEREFRRHLKSVTATARLQLAPKIIKDVPVEQWVKESPVTVDKWPARTSWKPFITGLFKRTDLVWIGGVHDTGRDYKHCFRTARQWVDEMDIPPGPQVCAAPLKETVVDQLHFRVIPQDESTGEHDLRGVRNFWRPEGRSHFIGAYVDGGTYSRAGESVETCPYIILESDVLTRMQFGSVARYTQKYATLRSLVDTAGKGIHAAFDRPALSYAKLRKFFAILIGLGVDRQTLERPCPTTRLPGYKRVDEDFNVMGIQRLLYLNPKYTIS